MKTPRLVPSWLKLQYPITKYAEDAQSGYWWDITASGLTTPQRAMAVSLRWRWLALSSQNEGFAGMIPDRRIRLDTLRQIEIERNTL